MPAETTTDTARGSALAIQTAASALAGFAATAVWGLTDTTGEFWPMWVWFGLLVPLALHAAVRYAIDSDAPYPIGLRVHAAVSVALAATEMVIWALTGFGDLWFFWPILALTVALAGHVLFRRLVLGQDIEGLQERVDELTRTRKGAVDVQAAELRRIERDLHDGAQARLVALTMQLGRAEQQLEDRPEVAELVRNARAEAGNAIAELRDLARGIAPPVLADRGLPAAVEAVAARSAIRATVDAQIARRPPPVVETAAYFVVAESLTNAAKHAGQDARAHVSVRDGAGRLTLEITDDGRGGADPAGSGLTGLRHRVEALDGHLTVTSAKGLGTVIRAELPF